MEVTRKQFVGTVLAGLAASAVSPTALFGQQLGRGGGRGSKLADFQGRIGTEFRFRGVDNGGFAYLTLKTARDAGSDAVAEQFTLEFLSPTGLEIPMGTYDVNQKGMGSFLLFIIPSGSSATGSTFRADFNLLRSGVSAAR